MSGSKIHFSTNHGTDMICHNNFSSKMIISVILNAFNDFNV